MCQGREATEARQALSRTAALPGAGRGLSVFGWAGTGGPHPSPCASNLFCPKFYFANVRLRQWSSYHPSEKLGRARTQH